ncbi:MAG: secretin N-terminal domain-containing protein [Pyrinomonadaceae bacterium]
MKRSIHLRFVVTLFILMSLLSPVSTFAAADNGKKYFAQGMKHESAEEWDKAVEQFALAVADSPKNPEYRLHLTRSLFNASQQFMKKGNTAAKEKDYEAGYLAFRRAYAFDPTNELAKSEMERMVRLQQEINEGSDPKNPKKDDRGKVKMVLTGGSAAVLPAAVQMPQKLEKLRDLPFPSGVDTQFIIKELARDLDLNVLFDKETFRVAGAKTFIDLKNVSAARALDYIFMQEGLFFQKVGPRTIIVANQGQRQKFQQMVLRTFYLANASPKDIVKVVQTAIPAQPGRSQTIVLQDEATNSVTIRDTSENIRLIGQLIKSLDKDRAEVVMDVAIYEVNKSDLLQFGNQVGTPSQLQGGLGGTQPGQIRLGGQGLLNTVTGTAVATAISSVIPTGILLPTASLSAFQKKDDTKLLAFSQIHAFNNEDSSARIGQRVPVQSAQYLGVGGTTGGNNGFGQTANVINYEQVGLTLKFKPIVFPNQDVQVAMEIESKDVAGGSTANPIFTERTIKGTARIQNNKTLLLASVAQGVESRGRQGLPLLGLIPIIGRLFTAPTRDNRQVDIVIAVTPRVIRAPAILPEDEIERETGSQGVPTTGTLQEMIIQEDRDELLAAARRLPTASDVQLPDQKVEYVKSDVAAVDVSKTKVDDADMTTPEALAAGIPGLKAIDNSAKTVQLNKTSNIVNPTIPEIVNTQAPAPLKTLEIKENTDNDKPAVPAEAKPAASENPEASSAIELRLGAELAEMKAGDKIKVPVLMQGSGAFRTATMGLKYDPAKLAVRSVSYGDVFGSMASSVATPFLNDKGKLYVSFISPEEKGLIPAGTLAFLEIEALVPGKPQIEFDRDMFNFQTAQGRNLMLKFQE